MAKHRSLEFKLEALELLKSSGRTVREVAAELGIGASALYRWQANPPRREVGARARAISDSEEVRQLRRELQRVRMERDILKKAVAFFAKEPK